MTRPTNMAKVAAEHGLTEDDPKFIRMVVKHLRKAGSTEKAAPDYDTSGRRLWAWCKARKITRVETATYVWEQDPEPAAERAS